MADDIKPITWEGVRITFKNFSGAELRFNEEGNRNFVVLIDDEEVAKAMEADGWNIRWLNPLVEGEPRQPSLQVSLKYRTREGRKIRFPPRVTLITSRGKSRLTEDDLDILDWADIINVDLSINPRVWNEQGAIKAYLKAGFFTIREDELELKYADVPESAQAAIITDQDEDVLD